MKKTSFFRDWYVLIPLVFSGMLFIGLLFLLLQKSEATPEFVTQLEDMVGVFMGMAGFIAALLLAYIASVAFRKRNLRDKAQTEWKNLIQKVYDFREIISLLLRSKMWLPGLKEYIDEEFAGLTFFQVKEFYKGKSKLAIEFLQENHNYAGTENLYLELKSLLFTEVKQKKLPENIATPREFSLPLIEKWLEHKCGSGLWYYFGYKYGAYKDALDLEAVFERHQEKIMLLANSIDSDVFEDSSFNEVFLSKLGEYMNKNIYPELFQLQKQNQSKMPALSLQFYGIFIALTWIGILLPLVTILLDLPTLLLCISYAFTASLLFFTSLTFFRFLSKNVSS
ncbi:hypothetical protein MG296_13580 [Flavobacteriaceae bacterium TK19130]|nr:hypothetical protein [Thermobacterium salinum]